MRNELTNVWKDQSGMVLVIALIMMVVLTLIGIASTFTSIFEIKLGGNKRGSTNAFYTAEAGLGVRANSANFLPGNFTPVVLGDLPGDLQNEPIVSRFTAPVLPLPGGVNFVDPPQAVIYNVKPEGYGQGGQGAGTTKMYIIDSTGRDQIEVGLLRSTSRVRAKYVDTVQDEMQN